VVVPIHRSVPKKAFDVLTKRIASRFILDNEIQTISNQVPPRRDLLNEAGTIIFTSGSTGEPKGVVLSKARSSSKLEMIQSMSGWGEGENALIGLQLTFSFGQWATWLTLLNGGCVHLRGRFDPSEYQSLMETGKIQRFPAVPTMLRHLLELGGDAAFNGQIMAGGEPLPAALGQRLRRAYPRAGIGDIYGLTETGTSDFFVKPVDYDRFAGSIGHAGHNIRWRIAPDTQELEIHTPWKMLGYLDAPELTQSVMTDGWFRTGDLVEEMESGALRLLGRAKDLILRSGNKISPLEVEAAFLQHHDVVAALVTGVNDPERGEAIHLALVLRSGSQISPDTLRTEATDYLEAFKLPDVIHLVDELPCGNTGKSDRKAFRRLIEAKKAE
jgi:long-chain acyl-CoA synthetase